MIYIIGGDEAAKPALNFDLVWRADWLIFLTTNRLTVLGVTIE